MKGPVIRLLAGVACLVLAAPAAPAAAPWREVFAAERDTAVFLTEAGALVRAPFHLADAETLWAPRSDERVVRLSASPHGGRAAWITRAFERDTTRLWVLGPRGVEQRVRYFALQPSAHGYERSEPAVPSTDDAGARGGRLVQASPFMRRRTSNTLDWTPDGTTVVFGYDGGIASLPVAGGTGFGAGRLGAMDLDVLAPSALVLVDAIDFRRPGDTSFPRVDQLDLERASIMSTRKRAPGRASYLLYPTPGQWRAFDADGLASATVRAASPRTVWWAEDGTVHAVRVDDPETTLEVEADAPIVWLGFDGAHRALAWAAGRRVLRRPEDGGDSTTVFETAAPIRAALPATGSAAVAFVTGDSLIVWTPGDDGVQRFPHAGPVPCAFYAGDGALLVAAGCDRGAPRLLRADREAGTLVDTGTPRVKKGVFHPLASGNWVLLFDPAPQPPRAIHAYDVRNGAWVEVANPGIAAWEMLAPGD